MLKKFRECKFEDLRFFAKILLENKDQDLDLPAKRFFITLLSNTCGAVLAHIKCFGKTCDEGFVLWGQFRRSMQLTDPGYH